MKRFVRIWRMALAALMTLAVVLAWPPVRSEAASSTGHAATTASDSHHARVEENSPQQALHGTLDEDCEASVIGCCVMTHCHPGISVVPHEMTTMAVCDETTAAAAVRGLGSDPRIILHPPRRMGI